MENKTLGVRILLGIVVGVLGAGMLLYLVPGQGTATISNADVVATVDNQDITATDIRTQLNRIQQNGSIPAALQPLYAQQVLSQLIFEKELEFAAKQYGISVTDQERADRIRQLIPTAFVGGAFVGNDQYAAEVQQRTGMGVSEFEDLVGQGIIEEKFRQLVTAGITVTPAEIEQEFRRRNEKVQITYVLIKPEDLQPKIQATDAELSAYFEKNKAKYNVPEQRVISYALLDLEQLRLKTNIPQSEVQAYYQQNLDKYKLPDRVHAAHILFKTVGKTDAEVAEIRQKAEDVLKKAKSGANFADLAKQYSEDTTKDQGGDLDWLVRGQTVPEFEQVAFSLPKGAISDLVKTEYGFHIIKIIDKQTARTQSLDEVYPQILGTLQEEQAERTADDLSEKMSNDIRHSGRISLPDLAKKYDLKLGETQPLQTNQPIPDVGNAPELSDTIFRLRVGDESAPIRTDRGFVVLSLKSIQPAHAATLAEVHDKVLDDYRQDTALTMAKNQAQQLANASKSGQDLTKAAKAIGQDAKTSDFISRTTALPEVGNANQIAAAFTLPDGQTGDPVALGNHWIVYRVVAHQQPNPDDLAKQRTDIAQQLLQERQDMAFEAFRASLDTDIKQKGKLQVNNDNLKRITTSNS